ncbi:MAG: nucleotidyltransferase family protein [Bdellovibrionota bacterium]|nr:MAG: nucleotidyltransferase family protein [Bdellovibrionota bacterium]
MPCGISDISAVILAGGLGTRLRSVVQDKPKVLAEVAGRPFISYLLHQISSAEIRHCVLCTGYLSEQVRASFGSAFHGMTLAYSEEQMLLGTAGALRFALPLVQSDPMLVLNGDSYCAADLNAFLSAHQQAKARASIYLTRVNNTSRYGCVRVSQNGSIVGFEEKGASQGAGLINAGIYLIQKELIQSLPKGKAISLEREVFPSLLGDRFVGFEGPHDIFIDIGTPDSYQQADALFRTWERGA